ncbi:MAG TPA: hypothetical protein VK957_02160 [Lunatimonas sp.]|nr:hypothetical protein [Lunatimonas sp.]
MKKTQFVLKPQSGLGNRIRAISSFIYMKNLVDADLHVIWEPDNSLNANFLDLFKSNPNFTLSESRFKFNVFLTRNKLVNSKFSFLRSIVGVYNNLIIKLIGFDVLLLENDISKNKLNLITEICKQNKKILIISGGDILEYKEGVQSFVPTDEITSTINRELLGFKKHMIGIHIRRTDHTISIANSPLYLYENKISEYIQKVSETGFFLATDDPNIESHFKEKFPGLMFTHEKTFGRDSKEGIVDAVIDLFLLSKTEKIYGSYWSSYSEMASILGDIELEVLHL